MNMRTLASIGNDLTMAGAMPHDDARKTTTPMREADANVLHNPGLLSGQNKLTATVVHGGITIAKKGHDCGVLIPHIAPDPMALLHTLTSSRKSMFSASKVRIEGAEPAACSAFSGPAYAPTPMLACANPVPLPAMGVYTSAGKNTVTFGLTPTDLAMGWMAIAVEGAIDVAAGAIAKKTGPWAPLAGPLIKAGLNNMKNTAQTAYAMYKGEPLNYEQTVPLPFLEEFAQVKRGLTRDEQGNVKRFVEVQIGGTDRRWELQDWELTEKVEERRWESGGDEAVIRNDEGTVRYRTDGSDRHGEVMVEGRDR